MNSSGDIIVTQTIRNAGNVGIYVRGSAEYGGAAILAVFVNVADPPPLAAAFDDSRPIVLTGQAGLIAQVVSVSGGRGSYSYGLIDGVGDNAGFTIGATDGRLSLTDAQDTPTILTAVATADDGHPNTPAVALSLTLRVVNALAFTPDRADIRLTTYQSVPFALHTATVENPSGGEVSYSLLSVSPPDFADNISFTPSDRIVNLTAVQTAPVSASIYIRASTTTELATLVLQLAAVNPPPLAAAFDDSRPIVLTGYSGLVATVNSGGGLGNYSYGLIDGAGDNAGFAIGVTDGRLSLTEAEDTPTTLTAAATVNDEHPNTPAVTLSLTLRVVDVLAFSPDRADIRITTYQSVPYALHTATVQNPSGGEVSYSLLSTFPANFTDNINFTPSDRIVILTADLTTPVSASIYIRATTATERATLVLQLAAVDPPPLAATWDNAGPTIFPDYSGLIAQVVDVRGGLGNYSYGLIDGVGDNASFTIGAADGRLSLTEAQDTPTTLTAAATVNDEHPNTPALTLTLTLAVPARPVLADASGAAPLSYTGGVASVANAPSGKWTLVFGDDNFTLGADGILRLTTAIGVSSVLTVSIAVDAPPLITLGYTLTIALCSFFDGCQPLVNYSGAGLDFDSAVWDTITEPLALSLVAAGADVNERLGNNTPLLMLARLGRPAAAAVLLANGAEVNVTGSFVVESVPSSAGVLHYMIDNATLRHVPLINLFIANGVDVNHRLREDGVLTDTPLDGYNRFTAPSELPAIIRAAGGKCSLVCVTVNGDIDIRLAGVSFEPPTVTATASTAGTMSAGDLYTARAYSGLGTRFVYDVVSVIPADISSSFSLISVDINSARLSLNSELAAQDLSVFIEATDRPSGDKATLRYVRLTPPPPALVGASLLVSPSYTGPVASITNASSGNWTLVAGDNNFTLGADGVLSLTTTIGVASTLTAAIVADELSRLTTLNYTLNVGVCSFYQNGCRPFVNYAGGTGFPWQRNAQLARDLIAAGADVEEIFNDPSNNGARTPLLYIAQNGSPEVINIFLDNGADINAVGYFQHQQFFSDFTNLGVLFYLSDSSNNSHPQRLSTFVARGVNINLLAKEVSYRGSRTTFSTPLDRYNDRNTYLADFMRAYGAKCFSKCNFGNGDIRLASVSFRPARVGAAAPIYRVAAGNLHTVRAATGLGSRFDYRVVSVIPADLSSSFSLISVDITIARLSLNSALELESGRTVSVIIEATDNNPLGDDTAILQYVHIIPPTPALVNASVFVLTGYTGAVASVAYAPGGEWSLLFGDDNFVLGTNGVLSLTAAQNGAATITASVRVSHERISPVTLGYTLLAVDELRFTPDKLAATITTSADNRAFLTASAVGPLSAVRYALISVVPANLEDRFTAFADGGVVSVLQPLTTPITLSLYIRASENIGGADRSATLLLTVAAVEAPVIFVDVPPAVSGAVLTSYTGAVASVTNAPFGKWTVIFGDDNFILGADGVLSLTTVITATTTLTAGIVVDESPLPLVTVGYTLSIRGCSFYKSGCLPFVNFDGSLWREWYGAGGGAALAQSLIAAGADPNEIGDVGIRDIPPLYYVINLGVPAAASVLLDNGADVNLLYKEFTLPANLFNHGFLHGLGGYNTNTSHAPTMLSLFVMHGADVNHKAMAVSRTDGSTVLYTPLDGYNGYISSDGGYDHGALIPIIKSFGGKCLIECRSGDVRLATVSFAPAAVAVTVLRLAAGDDLYTVQAYSGLGTLFDYQAVSTFPAGLESNFSVVSVDVNSARLSLNSALSFGQDVSIFVRATDLPSGDKATLRYAIRLPKPFLVNTSVFVLTGYTGAVASVTNALSFGFTVAFGDDNFTVGTNGVLRLTAAQNGAATITASVRVSDGNSLITLSYTLLAAEEFRFAPDKLAATITTYGDNRALLTALAVGPLSAVRYARISVVPADLEDRFTVFADGGVVSVLQSLTTATTLSLYIRASENISGADRSATLLLTVAAVDPPVFAAVLDDASPAVLTGHSGLVAQINSDGGRGGYAYGLQDGVGDNEHFAIGSTNGRLSLTDGRSAPTTLTAVATVDDEHPNTPAVTLSLILRIVKALDFAPNRADIRITTYQSVPYALHTATAENPSGAAISYSLLSASPPDFADNISVRPANGVVSLLSTPTAPLIASLYIRATTATERATLVLQLTVAFPPVLVNASGAVLVAYTGAVASITNVSPTSGFTVVFGDEHFTVGRDGVLSLTATINPRSLLTVSIVVDVPLPSLVTLGHTLTVAPCSFYTAGCQPFVNYNGGTRRTHHNGRIVSEVWPWVENLALAQSLVEAGADVNEFFSVLNIQGFGHIVFTPLLAVAEDGTPAVASLLLDAGADVRATGLFNQSTHTGVLYLIAQSSQPVSHELQLMSLFIAHGADVNLVTRDLRRFIPWRTPFDRYKYRNRNNLAVIIKEKFGGKCNSDCGSGIRGIRLASVSFAPAEVMVTVRDTAPGDIYTVQAASGLGTLFDYRVVSTSPAGLSSNFSLISVDVNSARLSLNSELGFGRTVSVFVEATDRPSGDKATLRYVQIIPPLPTLVNASVFVLTDYTGAVASVTNALSLGFTVVSGDDNFSVGTNGVLSLTAAQNGATTITAGVRVSHEGTPLITLGYTLLVAEELRFTPDKLAATITTYDTGVIHTAEALGGIIGHDISYLLLSTNPRAFFRNFDIPVFTDGRVILEQALTTAMTLSLYILVLEQPIGEMDPRRATLLLTVAAVAAAKPSFVNASIIVSLSYTGAVASVTNAPGGGFTVVFGDDNFSVGADGALSLTAEIAATSTLTASVAVNDGLSQITLGYTLNVGSCSFYTPGCQPFVDYDGSGRRFFDTVGWDSLSVPLARSIIAAGADVNEVLSIPGGGFNHIVDTPLFGVARYGTPAVASLLLAVGASVNAIGQYNPGLGVVSSIGVLDYLISTPGARVAQMAQLFIDYGVNVNLVRDEGGIPQRRSTPIDRIQPEFPVAASIIMAAGGKCLNTVIGCRSFHITLASVSFSPAEVTVTVGATVTGDLYTVQAATVWNPFDYRVVSTSPAGLESNFSVISVDVNSAILRLDSTLSQMSVFI